MYTYRSNRSCCIPLQCWIILNVPSWSYKKCALFTSGFNLKYVSLNNKQRSEWFINAMFYVILALHKLVGTSFVYICPCFSLIYYEDWKFHAQSVQSCSPNLEDSYKSRMNENQVVYFGVPNRRTGLNKRTGWNISRKLINAQGQIIIIL